MNTLTPKTKDFTKDGTPWELRPPEGKTWTLQSVIMTFDSNIQYDKGSSDMLVKLYAHGNDEPCKPIHRYSDLIDWIENATYHTRYDGLVEDSIHKFQINFSVKPVLGANSPLSHLTIEMEDGEPIKAQDGGEAKRARGEYFITEF